MNNKLSDKDKLDWQNFVNNKEKLEIKDKDFNFNQKKSFSSIDLHGYTLEEANLKISNFIKTCYENNIEKINVITGKGLRSKNIHDPYQSINLSILKYSVPSFIKENSNLMQKIISIDFEAVENPNKGNFDIFLKKKKL